MKLLNPNCSTTITKILVTDEEKEWINAKIIELGLDKESAECFLSDSEKKAKVEDSRWMNEEHDETWTGFNTMDALLKVKRDQISMDVKEPTPRERKKYELNTQGIITKAFIEKTSSDDEKSWVDLYKNLDKYFKLKKEFEGCEKRAKRKSKNQKKVL
jgi:hypothetical protein